jgi:hypothetical protein
VTQTTRTASCCGPSCTCTSCNRTNSACTKPRKLTGALTLRRSNAADRDALRRLAALDSSPAPTGDTLVAEHDGALVAAVTLDGRTAVADPFKPTASVIALLRAWSNQAQVAA